MLREINGHGSHRRRGAPDLHRDERRIGPVQHRQYRARQVRLGRKRRLGQPLARLTGYAWGENVGWINLSDLTAGKFVAVNSATTPLLCDVNHDGVKDGSDIQAFVNFLLSSGETWRDVCSADVEPTPDHT